MRKTLVSFVCASLTRVKTATAGLISIGFQIVPLICYIENNPVKARLCAVAGKWPFSSARFRDEYCCMVLRSTMTQRVEEKEESCPVIQSRHARSSQHETLPT